MFRSEVSLEGWRTSNPVDVVVFVDLFIVDIAFVFVDVVVFVVFVVFDIVDVAFVVFVVIVF